MARRFADQEVMPHLEGWEREGELPRTLLRLAGDLGLIGLAFPEASSTRWVGAALTPPSSSTSTAASLAGDGGGDPVGETDANLDSW